MEGCWKWRRHHATGSSDKDCQRWEVVVRVEMWVLGGERRDIEMEKIEEKKWEMCGCVVEEKWIRERKKMRAKNGEKMEKQEGNKEYGGRKVVSSRVWDVGEKKNEEKLGIKIGEKMGADGIRNKGRYEKRKKKKKNQIE